jgi:hypothetical protein
VRGGGRPPGARTGPPGVGADAAARHRALVAKPAATKTEPAPLDCPAVLGTGVSSNRMFCDVLTGRDPAGGIIIKLPPHTGPVTLTFDLHNRHTYSEELIKTNKAYRRYTATIGVLTADNTLLTRGVVQNEFRSAGDLIDRVGGGAGPGGVKAVAPTGQETITVTIDAPEEMVSILGENLKILRPEGVTDTFTTAGRPIAIISNAMITYRPRAVPATPTTKPRTTKPPAKPRTNQ